MTTMRTITPDIAAVLFPPAPAPAAPPLIDLADDQLRALGDHLASLPPRQAAAVIRYAAGVRAAEASVA